eukprot:TRINITY_DN8724_c1_g1_i3.p1 TRINITY_DN8724_c1_g1~~TRINITY_DN8724_c1_g1_i3.p1  ORF type:complete len:152 (+),score=34.68 TRINITY_DN8724_c1_g1_i3:220-675(+)
MMDSGSSPMEKIGSYLSGIMFGVGWWIFIDGAVYASYTNDPVTFVFGFYVPGFISTIALILINILEWKELYSTQNQGRARVWLLVAFLVGLGGVVSSIWIFADLYANPLQPVQPKSTYPGAAIVIQNILIFAAALVYRFGPAKTDDGMPFY